jgi:ribonuclease HI
MPSARTGIRQGRPGSLAALPTERNRVPSLRSGSGSRKDGHVTATYDIVFDGGSKGNPGLGYGSYEITLDDAVIAHNRLEYGDRVTNNQAEYTTLVRALEWLADHLGPAAATSAVRVHGDSQLVIRQLNGQWKIKDATLRGIAMDARVQIARFGTVTLSWHPRAVSVQRLGH